VRMVWYPDELVREAMVATCSIPNTWRSSMSVWRPRSRGSFRRGIKLSVRRRIRRPPPSLHYHQLWYRLLRGRHWQHWMVLPDWRPKQRQMLSPDLRPKQRRMLSPVELSLFASRAWPGGASIPETDLRRSQAGIQMHCVGYLSISARSCPLAVDSWGRRFPFEDGRGRSVGLSRLVRPLSVINS
jgi:hypothetical protein